MPAGLIFNANTRRITGTPTNGLPVTTYTYTVRDADGDTDSLTFNLNVRDPMPTFGGATIGNQTYALNTAIPTLQLPAATDGNAPLTYSLSPTLPAGLIFNAGTRRITGTPTVVSAARTYTYTVRDADGDTASLTFNLNVRDPMPTFGGAIVGNQSYALNTAISPLQLPAATDGNAPLTYSLTPALPAGLIFNANTRRITGTPTVMSAVRTYTYTVRDADGDTDSLTFTLNVGDPMPTFGIATIGDQSYTLGTAIPTLQLPVATNGNAPLTYSLAPALPTGLTFNASTRQITGTPTVSLSATTYTYTVTDTDGDTASLTFDLSVRDPMPTFGAATIGSQSYAVNTAISTLQLPAATDGNAPLTYGLSPTLPAGLTFNASTRQITGTPTVASAVRTYTYTVTDADGDTDSLTFTIRVAVKPTFGSATIGNQSYALNTAIPTLQLPAATGGAAPLTYSLSPTLPAGLTFSAGTRRITGTPTVVSAVRTYTYTVTDTNGETDSLTFTLRVRDPMPTFGGATVGDQSYLVNTAIPTLQLPVATDGNAPLTYSLAPALPTGLTFNASTRQITGTPTVSLSATTYTYTVTDADGDTDSLTFTLSILNLPVQAPTPTIIDIRSDRFTVDPGSLPASITEWQVGYREHRNVNIDLSDYSRIRSPGSQGGYALRTSRTSSVNVSSWNDIFNVNRVIISYFNENGDNNAVTLRELKVDDVIEIAVAGGLISYLIEEAKDESINNRCIFDGRVLNYEAGTGDFSPPSPAEFRLGWTVSATLFDFTHTLTGLDSITDYAIVTRYRNANGVGDWSPAVTATTLAPAPPAPTVTDITSSGLTVNPGSLPADVTGWRARHRRNVSIDLPDYSLIRSPGSQGGYALRTSRTGGGNISSWSEVPNINRIIISYFDDDGDNNADTLREFKVDDVIEIDVEGGTISYLIEEAKDESINNRCIFDGRVLSHAGSTGNFGGSTYAVFSLGWTVSADLTATTYMLTGLSPSTEYLLATRYVTAKGGGEWSPAVMATTRALTPPAPTVTNITSSGFTVESGPLPAGVTAWQMRYKRNNVNIDLSGYSDSTGFGTFSPGQYSLRHSMTPVLRVNNWAQALALMQILMHERDEDGTDQTSTFQSMKGGDVFEISFSGGTIIWLLASARAQAPNLYVLMGSVLSGNAGSSFNVGTSSPIEFSLTYRVPAQVTGTSQIVTELQSATEYTIQMRYISADGRPGDWSPAATAETREPAPSAPTVTDITSSGFTVESDTLPAGATAWQIRYKRNVNIELTNYSDASSTLNNGGYRLFSNNMQVMSWAQTALLNQIDINKRDDDGTDQTSTFQSMQGGDVFEISVSGGTLRWNLTSVSTITQDRYRLRGTRGGSNEGSSWNRGSSSPIELNLTWSAVGQFTGVDERVTAGILGSTEYIVERRYIAADGRGSDWSPAATVTTL